MSTLAWALVAVVAWLVMVTLIVLLVHGAALADRVQAPGAGEGAPVSGDIIGAAIDWLVAMDRATALARQSGARYRVCAIDGVWFYEPVSGTGRAR